MGSVRYVIYGVEEGRTVVFDGLRNIAPYRDMIRGFGTNTQDAALHCITNGISKALSVQFDAISYRLLYPDPGSGGVRTAPTRI